MDPIETAAGVASELLPPEVRNVSALTRWRMWMAGVVTMTALGSAIHVLLACGYIPFYPGFAMAGDADRVKGELTVQVAAMEHRVMSKIDAQAETLKTQRINTLKKDLFDARQKQCKAPSGAVRTMMTEQLSNMQTEYETLAGRPYTLPGCNDF